MPVLLKVKTEITENQISYSINKLLRIRNLSKNTVVAKYAIK